MDNEKIVGHYAIYDDLTTKQFDSIGSAEKTKPVLFYSKREGEHSRYYYWFYNNSKERLEEFSVGAWRVKNPSAFKSGAVQCEIIDPIGEIRNHSDYSDRAKRKNEIMSLLATVREYSSFPSWDLVDLTIKNKELTLENEELKKRITELESVNK